MWVSCSIQLKFNPIFKKTNNNNNNINNNNNNALCTNFFKNTLDKQRYKRSIIIMYIYHALINALNTHMIHINLNTTFYTHAAHSPPKQVT